MTNKEKKQYLNLIFVNQSTQFVSELERRNKFYSSIPKKLYKFRTFDDYAFEMLENEYVYLSSAEKLDDPFDCLTSIDLKNIYDFKNNTINDKIIKYIIEIILLYSPNNSIDEKTIFNILKKSISNNEIDETKFELEISKLNILTTNEKIKFNALMKNIKNTIANLLNKDIFNAFLKKTINFKKNVGICSLTTKRDNRVMWSLYGGVYKGYCIEYEIPKDNKVIFRLLPTFYTNNKDNNIVRRIIQLSINICVREMSNGNIETNIGCLMELLCTKNKDWKFQDEWRLIGNPNDKFQGLKVKNIYLGFDVSKENEQKILEYSKVNKFNVYKMNDPSTNNKITYSKIT